MHPALTVLLWEPLSQMTAGHQEKAYSQVLGSLHQAIFKTILSSRAAEGKGREAKGALLPCRIGSTLFWIPHHVSDDVNLESIRESTPRESSQPRAGRTAYASSVSWT